MATYVHNDLCLTPVMTADDAPTPNVVSASGNHYLYPAYYAFTQVVTGSDCWLVQTATGWLKFDFGSGNTGKAVKYSVSVTESQAGYGPKDWTLQGSNNDTDWGTLDTQTGAASWAGFEMREYSIAIPVDYRYYKIDITAGHDAGTIAIGELELIESSTVYYFSGYITEKDIPVSRKVSVYDRVTGGLEDTTTSSGSNGYYYLETTTSGTHFIVSFDDDEGEDYNALILDKLIPQEVV